MTPSPSFAEAARFWILLGFISFGGPAGQISILHRELVQRRAWIAEGPFLHALNFCMLLPGPEAQQLATYVGWSLHGVRGGLVAGVSFVLPSIGILLALSYAYAAYGTVAGVAGVLWGFKPVVTAVVLQAVSRIGRRALLRRIHYVIAALAFFAIHLFHVPFPVIVLLAAGAGLLAAGDGSRDRLPVPAALEPRANSKNRPPARGRVAATLGVALGLWAGVLVVVVASRGWGSLHAVEYRFFTRAAFVTFGGAYAVLAYVADAAVETYGWITGADAINGLALAETTPGPLIIVVQFVGFLAAWRQPEGLSPESSAILGALLTTWATFLPSTTFVLLGAPYVEALRGNRRLAAALQGITAAVVGVISSLALVFGRAVLVPADSGTGLDWAAAALGLGALLGILKLGLPVHWIVAAGGLAGLLRAYALL